MCVNTVVPRDSLRAVFTPSVLTGLRKNRCQSEQLRWRLDVLEACGPMPSDVWKAVEVRTWRAQKAAWEVYVQAAFFAGLFEGSAGDDLCARLTDVRDDNFRGAMAECAAAWFLACQMSFCVGRVPADRADSNIDMQIDLPYGTVGVEVKAPFRERPPLEQILWGDDSDKIAQCLSKAQKQFSDDRPNLLVIVPELTAKVFDHRETLVKAAYAKSVIVWDVFHGDGTPVDDPRTRTELRLTGKFLETKRPSSQKPLKADGLPAYRRISAVMCIEEMIKDKYPDPFPRLYELATADKRSAREYWPLYKRNRHAYLSTSNESWILHNVMILHNPYAYHPIPENTFGDLPQLVQRDGNMIWTDGYECAV